MRQVNFSVDDRVFDKLTGMARERGYAPTSYAKMLFEAAFACRVGVAADVDLDAAIARTILLHATKQTTADIAGAVGLSEPTVLKIINAWRDEIRSAA